jgi:uncharacterized protein YceK
LKEEIMKTAMTLIAAVLLVSGCGLASKTDAIRGAADAEQITGMDKDTQFMWAMKLRMPTLLSDTHPGPYRSIDDFNVNVDTGKYMGRNATFFLGKSRETGTWEVFCVMVEEEGKWQALPLTRAQ